MIDAMPLGLAVNFDVMPVRLLARPLIAINGA